MSRLTGPEELPGWEELRKLVDAAVAAAVCAENFPPRLWQSMLYTAGSGGKRLRGSLVLASCAVAGGDWRRALPAAVAVELIHAYSLIHDDLPLMDDDDFRRGRPTNHKVFGPAVALLAGDALQAYAFEVLVDQANGAPPELQLAWVRELSAAAGPGGLVGGQLVDWEVEEGRWQQLAEGELAAAGMLEYVHRHKTAALIRAAVRMGGLAAGLREEDDVLVRLGVYGAELGLAFQITDDLLDEVGDPEATGKEVGRDRRRGKLTYVALYGVPVAQAAARRAVWRAQEALTPLGERGLPLVQLAEQVLARTR
ncbi:MAG: polyprenyl synthetase family protein [Limnochordales bacterium]|nr:polyprenyl synthetase family protein [Limnochordales bacterium]